MEPQYEEQFTAFIDFLGFSEISTKADDELRLKVLNLLLAISGLRGEFDIKSTAHESGTTHLIKPAISTFSDHIVISYPLRLIHDGTGSDEDGTVTMVILHFRELLTRLAAAALRIGFLLRGGATVGKLYHARGVCFGEAMVEAFRLESRTSVYPRVVLSATITSRWNWIDKHLGIIKDNDGLHHIDYFLLLLFMSAAPGPRHNAEIKEWFSDVVQIISRNLVELGTEGKLNEFAKWAWFARQFRSGMERVDNHELWKTIGLSPSMLPWPT